MGNNACAAGLSCPRHEEGALRMLIRLGYDIQFEIPAEVAMVGMLHVHPSRGEDLREPDEVGISPEVQVQSYIDSYGNRCARWLAPAGPLRLVGSSLIEDPGNTRRRRSGCARASGERIPPETLRYLLNSRYCEVDRLVEYCGGTVWPFEAGMDPGAGHLRVDQLEGGIRISLCALVEDCAGRFHRAHRSLPRLPAPGGHILPGAEYSRPLRDRISGRHRRAEATHANGLQRVV